MSRYDIRADSTFKFENTTINVYTHALLTSTRAIHLMDEVRRGGARAGHSESLDESNRQSNGRSPPPQ
eukprot:6141694-Pyramimonas_sp.AAC.1